MEALFVSTAVLAVVLIYQFSPQREGATKKTHVTSLFFLGAGFIILVLKGFGVFIPSPMMLIKSVIDRLLGM